MYVGNDVPEDVHVDKDCELDVREHTRATTVQASNVVGDGAEYANAEVDYLLGKSLMSS